MSGRYESESPWHEHPARPGAHFSDRGSSAAEASSSQKVSSEIGPSHSAAIVSAVFRAHYRVISLTNMAADHGVQLAYGFGWQRMAAETASVSTVFLGAA